MINSANRGSGGPQQPAPYGYLWMQQTLAKRWASDLDDNPYYRVRLIKKADRLIHGRSKHQKISRQLEEFARPKAKESLVRLYCRSELPGAILRSLQLNSETFPASHIKNKAAKQVLIAAKNEKQKLQAEILLSKMKKQDSPTTKKTRVLNGDIATAKMSGFSENLQAVEGIDDALDSSGVYKCRLAVSDPSWSFLLKNVQKHANFPPWLKYCEFPTIPANYRLFKPMISSTVISIAGQLGIQIPKTLKFTEYSRSSCEEKQAEVPSREGVFNARIQQCSSRLSSSSSESSRSLCSSSSSSGRKVVQQKVKLSSGQKHMVQPDQPSNKWVAKIFGNGASPPRFVTLNSSNQREDQGHSGSTTHRQKRSTANLIKELPQKKPSNGSGSFKRMSSQMEVISKGRDDLLVTEYGLQFDSPVSKIKSSGQKNPADTGSSSKLGPVMSVRSSNQSSEVFNIQRVLIPSSGTTLGPDKHKRMSQRVHPHSEAEVNHVVSVLPRNTSFKQGSTQITSKEVKNSARQGLDNDSDETQVFNLKKIFLNSQASSSQLATNGANKHPTLPKEYGSTSHQEMMPKNYSIQAQIKAKVEQQSPRKKQPYAKLASHDDCSSDLHWSKANWRSEFNHSLADSPKSKSKHRQSPPVCQQQGLKGKSGQKLSDNSSEASPVLSSKVSPQLQSRILRPKQYHTQLTLEGQRSVRSSQKQSLWNGSCSPSKIEDTIGPKCPTSSFHQASQLQLWSCEPTGFQEVLDGRETRRSTYHNAANKMASKHSIPDLAQSYAETSRKHGSSSTAQESPVRQNGLAATFTNKLPLEKLNVGYVDSSSPASKQKRAQPVVQPTNYVSKPVDPDLERLLKAQERLEECKRRKKDLNKSKELKPRMVGDSFEGTAFVPSRIEITASGTFSPNQSKPSRVHRSPLVAEGIQAISSSQQSPNVRKPKLTLLQSSLISQAKSIVSRQPTMNSIEAQVPAWGVTCGSLVLDEEASQPSLSDKYMPDAVQFSWQTLKTAPKQPGSGQNSVIPARLHQMDDSPSRLVCSQVPQEAKMPASGNTTSGGLKLSTPSDSPGKSGSGLASPQRPNKLGNSPVQSTPGYSSSKNFSITPQNLKSASFKEACGDLASKGSNKSRKMDGQRQVVDFDSTPTENSTRKTDIGLKGLEKTISNFNLSNTEKNPWRIGGDVIGPPQEVSLYTSSKGGQESPGHRRRIGGTHHNHFS